MKHLTIFNPRQDAELAMQKVISPLDEKNPIYLVNNALNYADSTYLRFLRTFYSEQKKECMLFEYGQLTWSGKVVQDVLTFALNDPEIATVTYFEESDVRLNHSVNLVEKYNPVGLGLNTRIEDGMAMSTEAAALFWKQNLDVYKSFVSQKFIEDNMVITPSYTINSPFILNFNLLRIGMKDPRVAAAIQMAFQQAFNPEKEADFELFFGYMYNIFHKLTSPNHPILSFA